MFIYKYMSGIGETTPGDEEDDGYDPHLHRKIERPTSYMDTMIHLLKGSIGAGILAMPDAMRRTGIILGSVGVIVIGAFATYCIHLLILAQYEVCKRWRRGYMAYPKTMRLAVQHGPRGLRWAAPALYYFVDVVLVVWQLGLCCVYIIFVAENIKQICDFHGYKLDLRMHIAWQLLPQILLNLNKNLKLLTPISTISNTVTLLSLLLVYFYIIEDDLVATKDTIDVKKIEDIPLFIGVTLFAMEGVGVVLAIEYNMEDPKHFLGCCGLFNIGMFVIVVLYTLTGVFGFLKYGQDVKASLTLNLPEQEKKAQASKAMIALAIFLSVPLQNFVAYNIVFRKLKKSLRGRSQKCLDYSLRVILIVIPWCVAMAMPYLGPFIALFGAFCLSLLGIVFPGLLDVCVWYPRRYGVCCYKLFRDIFIILIGMFCLASGCYSSVLEIIHA